jgi:hypothetical protein
VLVQCELFIVWLWLRQHSFILEADSIEAVGYALKIRGTSGNSGGNKKTKFVILMKRVADKKFCLEMCQYPSMVLAYNT